MAERAPSPAELEHMRELVQAGMEEGAFGISTGLIYPPGAYAEDDELVELAKVIAPYDGMYASHMRDEGGRLLQSIAETIAVGEKAGVKVQISHHKAVGRYNYGKVKKSLALVDEARARGVDVTSDVYPYTAGSTILAAMFLPLWAFEGSPDDMIARMKDPETRKRIEKDSKDRMKKLIRLPGLLDKIVPKGLLVPAVIRELEKLIVVSSVKRQHDVEGMTLKELREKRGRALYDALLDLLVEEETAVAAIAHVMDENDVRSVMAHPASMIGTDGFNQREGKPHPRTYGTYPRILERYVRDLRLFSLEVAVHKMTGMVAKKLGLEDRGRIAPGMRADLVIFDPDHVHDRATYESPRQAPDGMPHVLVNGVFVVRDGKHTEARAGRVLAHRGRA
jgi:N-acyl-D-amino-acid deacylase